MNKIKKIFKNIYIVLFVFILIIVIFVMYIFNKKAAPIIINYANIQTKRVAIEVLKDTGLDEVNKIINNEKLYFIEKNNEGEIESIDFNTAALNDAMIAVSKNVRERFKKILRGKELPNENNQDIFYISSKKGIVCKVPFGIIFNNSFLSDYGPKVPVKIKYLGNVGVDVKTKVSNYGINSALIEAYIYVEVTQRALLPFITKDVKIVSKIPVIIKIVKGNSNNFLYKKEDL